MWQVHRLEWKTQIMNDIAVFESADIKKTKLDILSGQPDFSRGYVDGTLNIDKMIKICPRTYDAMVGCHIYSYLKAGNQYIPINLGWIENGAVITYNDLLPGRFGGHLRTPEEKGTFTPPNRIEDDIWYSANIADMQAYFEIKSEMHPQILYVEAPYGFGNIKPFNGMPKPRNKHFQYAVFWFGMAALLAALLGFSWWRKTR